MIRPPQEDGPNRLLFLICFLVGTLAVAVAFMMPSHLRAIDEHALREIGKKGAGVVDVGLTLIPTWVSTATLFSKEADALDLPQKIQLSGALKRAENSGAAWQTPPFKSPRLRELVAGPDDVKFVGETTLLELLRNRITRERIKEALGTVEAQRILQNLALTNTVTFAPANSAGGVPFEIAVVSTAMLFEEKAFDTSPMANFKDEVMRLATSASPTNQWSSLEEFYLNVFALAKRCTWEQVTAFTGKFKTLPEFDFTARFIQENEGKLPLLFTAGQLAAEADHVSQYMRRFGEQGERDIETALAGGVDSLKRILSQQTPIYRGGFRDGIINGLGLKSIFGTLVRFSAGSPGLALLYKFLLLGLGAFLIVFAFRFWRKADEEPYVWFPEFSAARQGLFCLFLLVLLVIFGEPFLVQGGAVDPPQVEPEPLWNLSVLGAISNTTPQTETGSMLNGSTIMALGIFFLVQASIYIVGLVKLAEIRKQPLSNGVKLKLLENEENLFDGGLYAGLFGTATSLVLLTLGVIKPSLIAAYASTLFGILFVALLKIVHVRPLKRKLILEAQSDAQPA